MYGLDDYKLDNYRLNAKKYVSGGQIDDTKLSTINNKGKGIAIWNKTDTFIDNRVHSVTFSDEGEVFVSSNNNSGVTLIKCDKNGANRQVLFDTVPNISDIFFENSEKRLYAITNGGTYLRKLDRDGRQIWSISSLGNMRRVVADSQYVYLTSTTGMFKINNQTQSIIFSYTTYPSDGISVDVPNNRILLTSNYTSNSGYPQAYGLTLAGALVWSGSFQGEGDYCKDVSVDGKGEACFLYTINANEIEKVTIRIYTISGGLRYRSSTRAHGAGRIVHDKSGYYATFTSYSGNPTVQKLDGLGSLVWSSSLYSGAYGIAADDGDIYVTSADNSRTISKLDGRVYYSIE
jgi:hypothetical protein